MDIRPWAPIFSVTLLISVFSGCITLEQDDGIIGIIVTLPPQREMVEAVGGDLVKVTVMVPPGENPHTYAPMPNQLIEVSRARAYLQVGSGVEFELLNSDRISSQNEELRIFDCSKGIDLIEMEGGHDHGGHEHEGGMDPHIWLSPLNAIIMVDNIYDAMVNIDPANSGTYAKNRDIYQARLAGLHEELTGLFTGHDGERFLVYHPSWGYLAHEYGIEQLAIESGGKDPGPASIAELIDEAKEEDIHVVFVSPQFYASSTSVIAEEIGGKVVRIDPLAEDYVDNMRTVGSKVLEGLN